MVVTIIISLGQGHAIVYLQYLLKHLMDFNEAHEALIDVNIILSRKKHLKKVVYSIIV
jgi:hypothetical protein